VGRWTLCIDFGTAYSKAAAAPREAWSAFDPDLVRPLMLGRVQETGNPFLLESAVLVDDDAVVFGRAAMARADALTHRRRMPLRSFKTLLSVSDLDRALNTNAPASVDPHRLFQMRDLIVLYLAYLLTAVDVAAAQDQLVAAAEDLEWRYAAPAWRTGDSAGQHDAVVRLFGEADAFRRRVGAAGLLEPRGLSLEAVRTILPEAMAAPSNYQIGLIFEATAAAAYTSIGLASHASHLLVVDMGAGTTDLAAIVREGQSLAELPEARLTLKQAGDFVDNTIANVVLDSCAWAKTEEQRGSLWIALQRQMRQIKESIFVDGAATIEHEGRRIGVRMRDVERHPDFRDFMASLTAAYDHVLGVVQDDALARGSREIEAVAVGGGAAAPFIHELIAKRRGNAKVSIVKRPATPASAHAESASGSLAPVFPQLAIAIGGALAPNPVLAVSGPSTRPARGQT
jgi:molecular chaperone DnaK (HSP70)